MIVNILTTIGVSVLGSIIVFGSIELLSRRAVRRMKAKIKRDHAYYAHKPRLWLHYQEDARLLIPWWKRMWK